MSEHAFRAVVYPLRLHCGRRVIEQGGFNVGPERETISDPKALIYVSDGLIVRVGKRKIARIRLV